MQKKLLIAIITIVNIIELLFIKPIIPAFFGMNFIWQVLYSISLFGFPILIIVPIALFLLPIALIFKKDKPFKSTWLEYTKNVFLTFAILIFIMNTTLVISKFVMDNDPFPLQKYSEIKGYKGSVKDLKIGEFESQFGNIYRYENKQVETYKNGDSTVFKLEWISNSEYRLVYQADESGMNDTLDVKITNNTPEFYECYLRFGEYAEFERITKK